jgi:hypothetical protein
MNVWLASRARGARLGRAVDAQEVNSVRVTVVVRMTVLSAPVLALPAPATADEEVDVWNAVEPSEEEAELKDEVDVWNAVEPAEEVELENEPDGLELPDDAAEELEIEDEADGLELPDDVAEELEIEDDDEDDEPAPERQLSRSKAIVPRMLTKFEVI